jgi:hypothetical protein
LQSSIRSSAEPNAATSSEKIGAPHSNPYASLLSRDSAHPVHVTRPDPTFFPDLYILHRMADDPTDPAEARQWLITFFLVIVAVVLAGTLVGLLLRGTGVR